MKLSEAEGLEVIARMLNVSSRNAVMHLIRSEWIQSTIGSEHNNRRRQT